MRLKYYFALALFPLFSLFAQNETVFIDLGPTGVSEFLQAHPEYDGRETIVLIFDTGVDIGIEGLLTTTTGETKVIDVRDFTKQGDVEIFEADTDEEDGVEYFVNEDKNLKVAGYKSLTYKPVDSDYFIGALTEEELKNSGSGAADLNGDGDIKDAYHLVTFQTGTDAEKFWVVYFDTDGDQDLSDEQPIRNYDVNQDKFHVVNQSGLPKLTFGLHIFPGQNLVNIHYDDGAHGTHCAGIAAGHRIGAADFNGVAPGAYLISAKLGNNNYAGGATVTESMKKCFLYADSLSKAVDMPCVINMSFGIASEIEGHADMEIFLAQLVKENPYLYICTSNGNEGPGISTAGLPAASDYVFSSGAVLTEAIGSNLYGANLPHDVILHFSSRGAEVAKPDIVAPGAATSTVPAWGTWDRFWGTSMASPYSAGVMSLLLSAAKKEFPDTKIPSLFLYKVIKESAEVFPEYTYADQGGGYINVVKAWDLLKKYVNEGEIKNFETYTTMALSPNMPNDAAPNFYLRDGSFLEGTEPYSFYVSRNNFIGQDQFYRLYDIKSEGEWLIPTQTQTYIRNDQPTSVDFKLDNAKMQEPGLYNGVIKAYRKGTDIQEFVLMATVVKPYEFNSGNKFEMSWTKEVAPGMHNRYFVDVPAGASAMKVKISSVEDNYASAQFRVHAPDGELISTSPVLGNEDNVERMYYDLENGVYEVVVHGHFLARDTSTYKLDIEFIGVENVADNRIDKDDNYIDLVNNFNKVAEYQVEAKMTGYKENYDVKLENEDEYYIPFTLRKGESKKTFEVEVSGEDFNKFTDFALMIFDEEGNAKASGALSYRSSSITIRNNFKEDSVELRLALLPGFAEAPSPIRVDIKGYTTFKNTEDIKVKAGRRNTVTLYPSIAERVYFDYNKPEAYVPENADYWGEVTFKNEKTDKNELEIPLFFIF